MVLIGTKIFIRAVLWTVIIYFRQYPFSQIEKQIYANFTPSTV